MEYKESFKNFYLPLLLFAVLIFLAAFLSVNENVYAAEEEIVTQEDDESELSIFGYYEEPQEVSLILTKIYNLLLTMLYFAILYVGTKFIKNLRKGRLYGSFD